MKAFFTTLILLIILIVIIGAFVAYHKVPELFEEKLSKKLGVPVKVENIHFYTDAFEITNLTIYNPKGSTLPIAFKAKTIRFEAPYLNYIHPHIIINRVAIDDVYVGIEFYDKDNTHGNWTKIIKNLNGDQDENQTKPPENGKKKPQRERTVLIKHLIITNINIELILKELGHKKLSPIDKIEFTNINSEQGLPIDEITELIVQKLMEQISILGGFGNMLKEIIFLPKEAVDVLFSPVQFLFGGGKGKQSSSPPQQPSQSSTEGGQ